MNKIATTSFGRIYQIYIRDEADESVYAEIFREGEYRSVKEVIKGATNPIIDIGAHSGLFTLYARSINPTIKIIAVEPEEKNLEFLRKHIFENDIQNVEIIEEAVSGKTGKRRLELSSDSHNHKLAPENEKNSENSVTIRSISLSDLLQKCIINDVGLVKMDVEGAEHEIFDNIDVETLGKIEAFIIEYHENESEGRKKIESKLRENGFGVQVFPSRFDKTMGFLFALNKR